VRGEASLDAQLSKPLPRPLEVRALRLDAVPGRRAVVVAVDIEGLREIGGAEARAFFMPDTGLYTPERARAWSVARARRAAEQLRDALRARGFEQAVVRVDDARPDSETGAVRLKVRVDEGPRWRVTTWRAEVAGGGELPGGAPEGLVGAAWSRGLALDAAQAVRARYFVLGHAEAGVSWRAEPGPSEPGAAERAVTAVARVEPGPAWTLREVRFEGAAKTRPETLAVRTRGLVSGRPYDPTEIDAARLRLARLGVFRQVEAAGEAPDGGGERDVVFRLMEEVRWQASWLIGYGSYEQLRGAVELTRTNLWGLAHRDRVELGQSLKGSRGEYRYTVPTLFNDTVEGSARVFGLRREEPSFVRVEYGAGVEAGRDVPWIDARGSAGLSYQVLRADRVELGDSGDDVNNSKVAAVMLGLARDVRDNPIRPREGHRWSARTELARPELGGDTRYERVELAWSWHRPLGGADAERWLHIGASHGVLTGAGEDAPVNKLFFPGGESSLRGYLEGEATQRDATGRFVGVRSTWLVNVELEQLVTGRWTAVLFSDTLGTAVDMDAWPNSEVLSSVGLGLRYQSPIGPLRLEYGLNLNPRDGDSSGTLHFSIGFPF
jgi:outer membrane protein assembly factor BamA